MEPTVLATPRIINSKEPLVYVEIKSACTEIGIPETRELQRGQSEEANGMKLVKKAARKYVMDCYASVIVVEITVISDNGM